MKTFLATFILCFVICLLFLFFGGVYILSNVWATIALVALIMSVMIAGFLHQEKLIEELETRIKALEAQYGTQT